MFISRMVMVLVGRRVRFSFLLVVMFIFFVLKLCLFDIKSKGGIVLC